jgi:NAD(P)-dependent dehydrogenase (short-subunit alcohol dehydrogenase family)
VTHNLASGKSELGTGSPKYAPAPTRWRLEEKVILVTGATSGIGEAIARRVLQEGASVLATGRSLSRGSRLADELGPNFHFHAADISDVGAANEITAAAVGRFGRLDVLVNNAAVDHTGELMSVSDDEIRETFEVNTFAAIRVLQSAASVMRSGRGGAIINITSRLASVGVPTMGIYAASKGALLALTRAAALELAPHNITVNAIAPGMTRTLLYDKWLAAQSEPEMTEASILSEIPLGRLAHAADVAGAVVYFASDEASYLTGVSLPVDGGYTAH